MKYGYFDDERFEYVITNPKTPVKWINYVGTLNFGGIIDHTGGMLLCKKDPALNRITKYIPQMPAGDFKGTTIYYRLKRDSGVQIFSPLFVPTLVPYELYECHIGLGYTTIKSRYFGIDTEVTYFSPDNESCVVWDIKISNGSGDNVSLDVIPVVEYSHPDAAKQFNNADWVPQTMQGRLMSRDVELAALMQYPYFKKETAVNFFTSNAPVSSFETDRARFLGDHEYASWQHPLALDRDELSDYETHRGDNISALMHHLGDLGAGQTRRLVIQLGQADSPAMAAPIIAKYRDEREVDQALDEMKAYWRTYLGKMHVETPNAAMNSMLNVFNPYQCHTTFNWSRFLSLYQLGLGARGIGFRDSSQDVLAVIDRIPEDALGLIRKLLSVQKPDGSAMHQFFPLTMEATIGDAKEREDRPDFYGDDHLWIVLAVADYIKETGDFDFLKEEIPYYSLDTKEPKQTGTVLEHLLRAVEFSRANVGRHGLPLLGYADWNDTVNLPTGAESLFVTNQYGKALRELIALFKAQEDVDNAEKYQRCYDEMKVNFEKYAWDGEWFIRYFDKAGEPLGSKSNKHCQIYANGQSWSVISGLADPAKAQQALQSLYDKLNTSKGIKLCTPGYEGWDENVGGITSYPPGAKENCGIFLHTNPWVMIAETLVGNGDRAFQYYDQINPVAKNDIIDEFECEPYVYPQNILSNEHPQFGLARNSWLSGTASWAYQAGTKFILGVMPTFEGLSINPCIPKAWDGFRVTRKFQGAAYNIEVKNPDHVSQGVKRVTVDGNLIDGVLLPNFKDGKAHTVEVLMGTS
jgi:cellobiose phosphorylase